MLFHQGRSTDPDFGNTLELVRFKLILNETLVPSGLLLVAEPEKKSEFIWSTFSAYEVLETLKERQSDCILAALGADKHHELEIGMKTFVCWC